MSTYKKLNSRFDKSKYFVYDEKLDRTPSRAEDIVFKKEICFRQRTACYISLMCDKLRCSQLSRVTAWQIMHRFYMQHSISKFRKEFVSSACVLLASKYEDYNRLLAEVVRAHCRLCRDPNSNKPFTDFQVKAVSDHIVQVETVIIDFLGVDLNFINPHYFITKAYKQYSAIYGTKPFKIAIMIASASVSMSMLPLQYSPQSIACACLYLSALHLDDQSFRQLVPDLVSNWSASENGLEYKHIARNFHRLIQATPPIFKQQIAFTLKESIFKVQASVVSEPISVQNPNSQSSQQQSQDAANSSLTQSSPSSSSSNVASVPGTVVESSSMPIGNSHTSVTRSIGRTIGDDKDIEPKRVKYEKSSSNINYQ